ncbi:hypothetical protein C206_29201 [Pseudomonas putida TRO1]|uniref:Uncharacterized protein n=1 Tax=Pseudomonas putida TRO1 TaxID=1227924 RepID=A0AAD2W4C4_PSEPU|nr:hypothetical protein C206_29201 [Pseudomonas putida TRO1]
MHTWGNTPDEFGKYQAFPRRIDHAYAGGVVKVRTSRQHPFGAVEARLLAADKRHFADRFFHYFDGLPGARILQPMVAHIVNEGCICTQDFGSDLQRFLAPVGGKGLEMALE